MTTTGDTRNESKRVEAEAPAPAALTIHNPGEFSAYLQTLDRTRAERTHVPMQRGEFCPTDMDGATRVALWMLQTGMLPKEVTTPATALLLVAEGMRLGIGPTQAASSMFIINGKAALYGDAVLGLVRASGKCKGIKEEWTNLDENGQPTDKTVAVCTVIRQDKDGEPETFVSEFSVADAKAAGLWGKGGPWKQYPKRMLRFRARSWACRDAFPDVLKGVGVAEEVADFDMPGRGDSRRRVANETDSPALDLPQRPESETATPAAA